MFSYGVDSKGLDFTGRWQPIEHLSLGVTGNWQDSTYKDIIAAGSAGADGNVLQRQPRFQARFIPAYDIPMGPSDLRFFLTYSYIGLRYSDRATRRCCRRIRRSTRASCRRSGSTSSWGCRAPT